MKSELKDATPEAKRRNLNGTIHRDIHDALNAYNARLYKESELPLEFKGVIHKDINEAYDAYIRFLELPDI